MIPRIIDLHQEQYDAAIRRLVRDGDSQAFMRNMQRLGFTALDLRRTLAEIEAELTHRAAHDAAQEYFRRVED